MPQPRTPFDIFQDAITAGVKDNVHDCWHDFACWEKVRHFADDPSHPAKAAIEWVLVMEELRSGLNEFNGAAKQDCVAALDVANEAFAKLHHSDELIHTVERWKDYRLDEIASGKRSSDVL